MMWRKPASIASPIAARVASSSMSPPAIFQMSACSAAMRRVADEAAADHDRRVRALHGFRATERLREPDVGTVEVERFGP
ncbi:hypothetical protein AWN90_37520 [Nocardia terpenica]|uniref:Uncharacterized protein n=1 Tax=Nocardia terpenica TaxID=455432 RepID=A0A164L2B6_9NOCA|nr:hypothetical protein AWN90_37520 [Nocardia terpenica]